MLWLETLDGNKEIHGWFEIRTPVGERVYEEHTGYGLTFKERGG
ncbi:MULTISPECIES: hypothetical protein [Clostridiaceae]|nr:MULTISPECIES: hypothetical protein [Clostridiaceae]